MTPNTHKELNFLLQRHLYLRNTRQIKYLLNSTFNIQWEIINFDILDFLL